MTPPYAILEAPCSLGLSKDGLEGLAARLLELGLQERIAARMAGRVASPRKDPTPDPATGVLNAQGDSRMVSCSGGRRDGCSRQKRIPCCPRR